MQYKVGVIGKIGTNDQCDGQTVKTRNLMNLLNSTGCVSLRKADTWYFKKNKWKLMMDTMGCLIHCDHIFLMVSVNGMHFYLPFLFWVNKVFRRNIYHYVIGSELLEMVRNERQLVKYLNALSVNWFEYDSGTAFLKSKGITNVRTLPNFKMLTPVDQVWPYDSEQGFFRFCTFSRVMEEKGITNAIETVARINNEHGKIIAKLDVYGPVESTYTQDFEGLLDAHQDCVNYCGVADSAASVDILKEYYALLFPTHWAGEGVPGTVIDAFASGLPVIASDWNANRELIHHHSQGLLYPEMDMSSLYDAVLWSISHPDEMSKMRVESRNEYTKYMPETILATILRQMEKNA